MYFRCSYIKAFDRKDGYIIQLLKCLLGTQEAKAGGFLEFKASLIYIESSKIELYREFVSFKKKNNLKRWKFGPGAARL